MPVLAKVTIDGKEVEVELPEGYLSPDLVSEGFMRKETFMPEVERRVKTMNKGMVKSDDLLENEDFLTKMLLKQGKELFDSEKAKKGKKGDSDVDAMLAQRLAEAQTDWRKKELTPLQENLIKTEGTISTLRARILNGQILQESINLGIKESFLKSPSEGGIVPIVSMLRGTFRYDNEHNEFFVSKSDEEFEFSNKPEEGHPYKTVSEFMIDWAGRKENVDFVDIERKRGPGLGGPGRGQQRGKDVVLSQAEASDHGTYIAAEERAKKQGGRVVTQVSTSPLGGVEE